ncbi:lipoyl synthase [Desulfovibrio inopinatus]|uniref:lipoyl synthase n=1 Tax=Desulfovibrio inopinatus TaxID=102109 RepID=UPI0005584001|nr:lipoyl synthase [Desulfovibrio inopinatus]
MSASSSNTSLKRKRLPPWLRVRLPGSSDFAETKGLVAKKGLHTVCENARCPNIFECYEKKSATFLIMGEICTRFCTFCNIAGARPVTPQPLDPGEPNRVAEAAVELGAKHVVITSVTRDDLVDGGAAHFAATIRAVHKALPGASVEVLIPDFKADSDALECVIAAEPDIINHNVETVVELQPLIRPQANFERSLGVLSLVKKLSPGLLTKSGLMVGLGEDDEQVRQTLVQLAGIDCDIVTIGQYLSPSRKHREPDRYVFPETFDAYAEFGHAAGIPYVFSGPRVRSSYNAATIMNRLKANLES